MKFSQSDSPFTPANIFQTIRWDAQGLAPAIIQDAASKNVLMLAYMNAEALKNTLQSKETWFWSRSRGELWHKGATSGNTQQVKSIAYDCDADTLLIKVIPNGPACHTGRHHCFFNPVPLTNAEDVDQGLVDKEEMIVEKAASDAQDVRSAHSSAQRFAILAELESIIAEREAERPDGAYTTYLFEQGVDKILKKIGEEAAEVIIAAKNHNNKELCYESSDLIFHLMVLLRNEKLPLDEIMRELQHRHIK